MNKKLVLILFSVLIAPLTFSQNYLSSPEIKLYEHNPATPQASGLAKYLEIPVNMSTGQPSIQLPLFSIKSGNINLPIVLKYHAGGIKVNELAGWVGMGWTLDVGGAVSKKVNGLDDFFESNANRFPYFVFTPNNNMFHPTISTINEAIDDANNLVLTDPVAYKTFLGRIANGNVDGEADEFLFSTPEGSGKIVYNQERLQFQINKINGWKAYFNLQNSPIINAKWDIVSTSGINYHFGAIELEKHPLIYNPPAGQSIHPQLHSSWHLSEIEDYVNNKKVLIYYNSPWKLFNTGDSYTWELASAGNLASQSVAGYYKEMQESTVDHISFDNGQVQFIPQTTPGSPLKEMRVLDNSSKIIKRILFNYFYDTARLANGQPDPQGLTLFLNSIQEINITTAGDTLRNAPYTFTYNFNKHVPRRFSYAQDSWGYFNGKLNNPNLIPNDILVAYNSPMAGLGADRSIDTACAKAGIIKEIIYPTGGRTIFNFENNRDEWEITGGLRIKSLTNYDPVTNSSMNTVYDYKNANGVETGYRMFRPKFSYQYYRAENDGNGDLLLRIEDQPIAPLFAYQGSPVMYQQVTKKMTGTQGDIISKHYFSLPVILDGIPGEGEGVPHNKISYDDNGGELEYKTEIYKNINNSQSLVKQNETTSGTLKNYTDRFWNIQAAWAKFGTWTTWTGNDPFNQVGLNMDVWTHAYRQFRESTVPIEKTETDFSNGQASTQKFFFFYDTSNGNTQMIKSINSKGDTLIKVIKYAPDYQLINSSPVLWNNVIESMMAVNLISSPVEVATYIKKPNTSQALLTDATLLQYIGGKVRKVYKLFSEVPLTDFQPSYNNSSGFYFDSRYKLDQEVTQTDANNNALTVIGNTKTESYLWDYQAALPVAHVVNSANQNIAFSSFETINTGNWIITGGSVNATTAITGTKSYSLTAGSSISKNTLDPGNYIISYWSKNGSMTVNGSMTSSGVTKNGWTYYEHDVSTSGIVTLTGIGSIDELRLYPKGALMSTYTYEPLIGITNQCDANNRISYYLYDSFNRLSIVKDHDNNVVRKICYNYAGQPSACSGNGFGNQPASQTFTRNNCAADYAGTTGTYAVAADTYFSAISLADANAQALADISANGQNYVNNNPAGGAICQPMVKALNTAGMPYTVSCTPVAGGAAITFSANPNTISSQVGQLTPGNYNIQITPNTSGFSGQLKLNGTTYSGTSFSFSNFAVTTPLYLEFSPASGPCSYTVSPGYSSPSNNISSSGSLVTGYFVFYSTSTLTPGNTYNIATINGGCRPSAVRSFTTSSGGRNWMVTIYPSGTMNVQITSGAPLSPYGTVSLNISYSL